MSVDLDLEKKLRSVIVESKSCPREAFSSYLYSILDSIPLENQTRVRSIHRPHIFPLI
jgi:hypothetical protein